GAHEKHRDAVFSGRQIVFDTSCFAPAGRAIFGFMKWTRKYRAIVDGTSQPWEIDPAWQDGRITPVRRHALAGVLFGILWIVAVAAFAASVVFGAEELIGLVTLLFLGPGIYILIRSSRRLRVEKKHPHIHLKPAKIPVAPGDRFECVLYSGADPARFSASQVVFNVRVTANKWVEQSTASDRSGPRKRRYVMWERNIAVSAVSGVSEFGSTLVGRFGIDLPEEQEPTSRLPGSVTYDWRMEIDASESLPGYKYEFTLPVFDTRSSMQRADDALGTVTEYDAVLDGDNGSDNGQGTPRAPDSPVARGDLEGLRAYIQEVHDQRQELDARPTVKRLFRGLVPLTSLQRNGDMAVSVVHVKGDPSVRTVRRLLAFAAFLLAFFLAGPPTLLFLIVSLVLVFMGRAAKPAAIAVHGDQSGLQIDEIRGKKTRSDTYEWSSIGMIADTKFSMFYEDIMLPRPGRATATLGVRIPSKREAEGIAAAIESVKDRYRG
ncbi:MAG: hypothetical protein EA383_01265, partial [Spirochaetaceae bacterium]